MKHKEGLTVVIPVYNRERLVARTLESIATQSRLPDEVILVDNNSRDGTLRVLEEWRDRMAGSAATAAMRVRVVSEKRPGAARARQTGLELTATDKVLFFDSDDVMRSDHIDRVYKMFEAHPGADIVAWPVTTHFRNGGSKKKPVLPGRPMDNHQLHALLCTLGYAVRTDYIRRVGGWDVTVGGWDDLELGHRLLLGSPQIVVSDRSTLDVYDQGEGSITGADYTHRRGEWESVIDKMETATLKSDYPQKDHVMRLLAYRRGILAALYAREGNREAAAEQLEVALRSEYLNAARRLYLRLAYAVTSRGVPGAARPVPYIF